MITLGNQSTRLYAIPIIGIAIGLMGCLSGLTRATSTPTMSGFPLVAEIAVNDPADFIDDEYENFRVVEIEWQPDGTMIAVGGHSHTYLYDFASNTMHYLRDEPGTTNELAWSPDGMLLAGSARRVWVYDVVTQSIRESPNSEAEYDYFSGVLWTPDGMSVVSTWTRSIVYQFDIQVWDLSANVLSDFPLEELSSATAFDLSPDGRLLAVTFGGDYMVGIVDLEARELIRILTGDAGRVSNYRQPLDAHGPAAWSPGGDMLVTEGPEDGTLIIWDTASWEPLIFIQGFGDPLAELEWHPSGEHIAVGSMDGVRVWNVHTRAYAPIQSELWATAVDWSPDGTILATGQDRTLYLWDATQLP